MGYSISVIQSTPKGAASKVAWIGNEHLSKIKRYSCSKHFLVDWLNDYDSTLSFLKIRISNFFLNLFFKGTIYDKAIGIKHKYLELAREVIKKDNIDTVFVTGAPFNLLYYTAALKTEFSHVKIVADYRDPWIKAHNLGMLNLSRKKENDELNKQNYVFEHVDYVTAPNSILLKEIKNTYTGASPNLAKFIELPHAFDPDDVLKGKSELYKNGKILIVYAGTLYFGIEKYLYFLNESFNYARARGAPSLVDIGFYTKQREHEAIFKENIDSIKFFDAIGDDIFEIIKSSDFILILLTEYNKNYLTSKFFEFLPYKKPYLYLGPQGVVSDKIKAEGLGYCLTDPTDLYKVISATSRLTPSGEAIERYSFDRVTENFLTDIGDKVIGL